MFRRTLTLSFLPAALVPTATCAQSRDGLTVSGTARARGEAIDGQFRPSNDDGGALLLRFTLRADYRAGPITVVGEVQDSRVYFERRRSSVGTAEIDTVEPIQAYIGADLGGNLSVKAGRQTMDFGSRRLVARNAFRNTTNAFTGARLDWTPAKGDRVTAFWTMPITRYPDDRDGLFDNAIRLDRERSAQQFFGIDATKAAGSASLETYVYRLAEHDGAHFATRNRRLWTIGARAIRKPARGTVDYEAEGAYQFGTTRATTAATDRTDRSVAAGFVHAEAGYTFAIRWAPRVALLYDYASGDGSGRRYSRFDPLFGARGFDFGPTSLYGAVSRSNVSSPAARVGIAPDKRLSLAVTTRLLRLASASDSFAATGVRDTSGKSGHDAGTQFDVRALYWLFPDRLQLSAGGAYLAKGRFLERAPNAPATGDTRYVFTEMSLAF